MADPRSIRRLAFQALFQLDARGEASADDVRAWLDIMDGFENRERDEAFALAREAFAQREQADHDMLELAPDWPPHRQPAVDRAILRLAHYEIVSKRCEPKIAVNEAIELAKEFSTDRSPAFVNGLLDKILKRAMGLAPEPLSAEELDEADAAQASENGDDGGGSGEPASPDRASNTPPFEESQT